MLFPRLLLLRLSAALLASTAAAGTNTDGTSVDKFIVKEGDSVTLPCSMTNKENLRGTVFDWRKDGLEVFLYVAGSYYGNGREGQDEQYKGRVSHFEEELKDGNSSILIRNTQIADSGNYTCVIPHLLPGRTFYSELVVGAAPKPSIKTHCETKDGVQLQCEVHGASPKPHVQWQDRAGNIVPAEEPQVSERGGSYDIVLNTTVTKTDHYRCVSTQDEINHQIYSETFVHINGAASKPHVTTLEQTKDGVQLQCEVHGASPKPHVQWQDRDGNIVPAEEPQVSERGGSYDIVLQTTVTKTDYYRCVSTQDEINHQIHAEILVLVPKNHTGGMTPVGFAVGAVLALLVVGVVLFVLFKTGRINCKKDQPVKSSISSEESHLKTHHQDP